MQCRHLAACTLHIHQKTPPLPVLVLQAVLKSIIGTALEVSKLQEFTGRDKPTVIT